MPSNRRIYLNRETINKLWKRDRGVCQYCGEPAIEIDHIIPYGLYDSSQGHEIDNLALSCLLCNRLAGGKIFNDFIEKKNYILDKRLKRIAKYYKFPSGPQGQAKEEKPKPLRKLPKGLIFISKKTKVVSPADKIQGKAKCSGPLCEVEFEKGKSWSKFHSPKCRMDYWVIKRAMKIITEMLEKQTRRSGYAG